MKKENKGHWLYLIFWQLKRTKINIIYNKRLMHREGCMHGEFIYIKGKCAFIVKDLE